MVVATPNLCLVHDASFDHDMSCHLAPIGLMDCGFCSVDGDAPKDGCRSGSLRTMRRAFSRRKARRLFRLGFHLANIPTQSLDFSDWVEERLASGGQMLDTRQDLTRRIWCYPLRWTWTHRRTICSSLYNNPAEL